MKSNLAAVMLRWGLAFVFFYAAVASLRDPQVWAQYLPHLLTDHFSNRLLIAGFAGYELLLAAWLFWGKKLAWSSILAALTLAGIVLFNLDNLDIVFRDVGLLMAALALFELAREKD